MKYQPPFVPGATPGTPGIYNANPDAGYINGDPETGIEGSYFPAPAIEHPQRELAKIITSSGIDPDHTVLEQVAEASARYASQGVGGIGAGTGSAHVVSHLGGTVAPKAYFDGMLLLYAPLAANAGAVTCAAFGLPAKAVVSYLDQALTGGEFSAARPAALRFNGTLDKWVLLPWTAANFPPISGGGSPPGAPTALAQSVTTPNATPIVISLTATGTVSSFSIHTGPSHGTVALSGSVATYTPTGAYAGTDSFTFQAIGPGGASAAATVSLIVQAVPLVPPVSYAHSLTFTNTGAGQAWAVPAGTTWVKIQAWGAYADWYGSGNGGNGYAKGEFHVGDGQISVADILRLMVGTPGRATSGAGTANPVIDAAATYGFGGSGIATVASSGQLGMSGSGLTGVFKPGGAIAAADCAAGTALVVAGGSGGIQYKYNVINATSVGANQTGSGDQSTAVGQNATDDGYNSRGGGGGGFRGGHAGGVSTNASSGSNYIDGGAFAAVNQSGVNGQVLLGGAATPGHPAPTSTALAITNGDQAKIIISWN